MGLVYLLELSPNPTDKVVKVKTDSGTYEVNLSSTESQVLLKPVNEGSLVEISVKGIDDVLSFTANGIPDISSTVGTIRTVKSTDEVVVAPEPVTRVVNVINVEATVSAHSDDTSVEPPAPEPPVIHDDPVAIPVVDPETPPPND